jgi:hypothetical protein
MIEIPTFKLLLVVYCFTGVHLFNYNVVEIKDFDYKHDHSNDSIEHYYCKDKYNVGDTIRHFYTIMVDSTSEKAIDYKKGVELLKAWAEETRLQEEAWAKDTVYQNKIKREKQEEEDKEWWSELDQAYEEQIKSEKLESKPIKKPE